MMRAVKPVPTLLLLALTACTATHAPPPPPEKPKAPVDSLIVDASLGKSDPRTTAKIAQSPFAYFRYTNRPFVDRVCRKWANVIPSMPQVHEHGDAHLEQYAVAEDSRGLSDYDASAIGPPVVDLARFATSLVLAMPGDPRAARNAVDALMAGYEQVLDDPTATMPEPIVAARLRARFAPTRREWLDTVQKLIRPTRREDMPRYEDGWSQLYAQIKQRYPTYDTAFFTVKAGGMLDMGIGSAHTEKFIARIEGPTKAPDDDVVIEAKAVEGDALGSCMTGQDLGAGRIVRGQSQMSRAPQKFLGAVTVNGRAFYTHSWLVHYTEVSVHDVRSGQELAELAQDVGMQLGLGHAKLADASRVPAQRAALMQAARLVAPTLADASVELSQDVIQAWMTFRGSLAP